MVMKRKIILSLLSLVCLGTVTSFAQCQWEMAQPPHLSNTEVGIKAGGNFQQINAFYFDQSYRPGYIGGLYLEHRWNILGLRLEATASSARYVSERPAAKRYAMPYEVFSADTVGKSDLNLMYLNIPIIGEINASKHLTVLFGVQYSTLLSTVDNNGVYTKINKPQNAFRKENISALTGLEFKFAKRFKIGATYTMGFEDINNHQIAGVDDTWLTGSAQVYLLFRLRKWAKY